MLRLPVHIRSIAEQLQAEVAAGFLHIPEQLLFPYINYRCVCAGADSSGLAYSCLIAPFRANADQKTGR